MDTKVHIHDQQLPYKSSEIKNAPKVEILFFDLTHLSPRNQFLFASFFVFALYVMYGFFQELIFTLDSFKPYGWYLTLIQFGFYSIFGFIETRIRSTQQRKIPIKIYALLALLTLGTMGFSNSSLAYLNYPTQVIFKCCKLIPVMVGSIMILRKRYGLIDLTAAICMCVGLSVFTLADSKISPNFHTLGVIMICCALLCDAMIGNVQEKYMKQFCASNHEVVLYSYAIGFVYLFVLMCLFGNLGDAIETTFKMPVVYGYATLFSLTGYLGMQAVLTLVTTCGALVAVTVTTCRKAVSIVLSFFMFSKPFTIQYLVGGLLVLMGIYLNVLAKSKMPLIMKLNSVSALREATRVFRRKLAGKHKSVHMDV